ncbi:peptidoglycan-binding domain-containing protein [Salipiger sp. CCB-MM3]|uniref:peptidoglycan-binding domain-containing protein n=1 Tax=Salipiger sp. CCB-MM3 TaxID=1792508 RepID=UPI0012FBA4B8|nr:hypothetical protein [Salipiger sp. CCB-MM3]
MNRRSFIAATAASICMAAAPALAYEPITISELEARFRQFPADMRKYLQETLKSHGHYQGGIDGSWGPGTARGYELLMQTPRYRKYAPTWTWARDAQVVETLTFYTTDAWVD